MLSPDSCGLCVCRPLTGPRLSAAVPAAWWKHWLVWKHDAPHEAQDVQPTRAAVRRAKSIGRAINTGQGFWSSVRCCWDGRRSQNPSDASNMLIQRMWNLRNRFCSPHSRIIGHFPLLLQASQMFRFLPPSSHHSGAELAPRQHPFVWKDSYFSSPGGFRPSWTLPRAQTLQVTVPLQDNGLHGNASGPIGGPNQVWRRQEPSNLPNKQETLLEVIQLEENATKKHFGMEVKDA